MYDVLTEDGLIITGDRGVGKSILAKVIAESRGEYIITSIEDFYGAHFSPAGVDEVATVIVEDFDPTPQTMSVAKALVTNEFLEVNFRMCKLFKIKAPHFIFVTNALLVLATTNRRFKVITLKSYAK